jgi:CTD small phosphatase-like protein 2
MIIIDNLVHSFGHQLENGFPILEWKDDPNDKELVFLAEYLIEAHEYDDIRNFNKKKLGKIS